MQNQKLKTSHCYDCSIHTYLFSWLQANERGATKKKEGVYNTLGGWLGCFLSTTVPRTWTIRLRSRPLRPRVWPAAAESLPGSPRACRGHPPADPGRSIPGGKEGYNGIAQDFKNIPRKGFGRNTEITTRILYLSRANRAVACLCPTGLTCCE